jgi:hypothetical protein
LSKLLAGASTIGDSVGMATQQATPVIGLTTDDPAAIADRPVHGWRHPISQFG